MANRQETIIIDVQVTDVKKQLGDTAKAINDLKEQNKQLKKEQKDGTADWAESTATIKANEAQIKLLTAAEKSLEGQLRAATSENKKYGQSNVELRAQVADLERQYNALTDAQKNTAAGKALLQQQNELKAAVKGSAEELGNFQDSVGNYEKGNKNFSESLDMIEGSAGGVIQGFKGMLTSAKAFIANPIGLVLAAIAGAATLLYKAFSRTQENMNTLKTATGALSGVFNGLLKVLEPIAVFIVNNVVKGFELAAKGILKVTESIAKALDFIGAESAAKGLRDFSKATQEAAKSGSELAKAEAQLEKQQRESRKIQLQYQRDAEKLRQIRDDESKTIPQRIAANNALGETLKKQADAELAIANQAVNVAKMRIKINGATKENLDELAAKETEVIDIKERITGQESEQLMNLNSLRKEAADKQKEILDKQAENVKKAAEARKAAEQKAEDERLKALKDQADKEIAALDQELALEKLRVQEKNAGKKLSNEEYHKQRLAEIDAETVNIIGKLNAQLRAGEITEKQFEDANTLRRQEVRTQIAEENAAFEAQELENRRVAAATDLQNEMAIAEMKNQSLYSLKLQQLENERLAEIEAAEKTGADTLLIEEKYTELKKQLSRAEMAAKLDMASGFAGNIAEIFGKSTKVGKAAASAQIAIDSAKGAFAAFTSMASIPFVGPVLGAAAAGAVVAKGVKAIKDVWAVKSGLPNDGGGGGATAPAAPTGTATTYTPATKGADLVLNSDQAGSLNGKISAAQPASGGIDYDLLAKSMSKQPAPVMVYSEFKSFEGKVTSFDEQTKI